MSDHWIIIHPGGEYHLNPTFHPAGSLYPGAAPTSAAVRHASTGGFVRVGDGLRTPGPMALTGRLWSDARDWAALRAELADLEAAVRVSTALVRINPNYEYTYANLAGGPTIEVQPDGLSGYIVRLEFWPGKANVTNVPVLSGADPVPLPPAARYRLTSYETAGSAIADLSEWWLGTDSVNRFSGLPVTSKSTGGTADQLVNDILTDSANQSIGTGLTNGGWWDIEYPDAQQLAYTKVARPNTTATRRLRTWAVRIPHPTASQYVTALLRNYTDDMGAHSTYAPFDLAGKLVLLEPLLGSTVGSASVDSTLVTPNINRPSYVEQNDAILFLAGALDGANAPQAITPPLGVSTILNNPGLFIGYRLTNENTTEPTAYSFGNPNKTGMVIVNRTVHNLDIANPVAALSILTGTPSAPSISVDPKNSIVVVALYDTATTPSPTDLPAGFEFLMQRNRTTGAAGRPRVLAGIRTQQDVGTFDPGNFGGTPLITVTIALNPTRPIAS